MMSSNNSLSSAEGTRERPLAVMKFGGTSVGSSGRMRRLVEIVERAAGEGRVLVVVSALSKVTRLLVIAVEKAAAGAASEAILSELRARHHAQAGEVLRPKTLARYEAVLDEHLGALGTRLERLRTEGATPPLRDAVVATGEQLCVPLAALALEDAGLCVRPADATRLVCTDDAHGQAGVDLETTAAQVRAWYAALPDEAVPVVAGFIGATAEGAVTTLGFEGSDYSAALFASILGASALVRWTDVDGLYTADPRLDAAAERLTRIGLEEAAALNEAGRLGMHPKALRPLLEAGIPAHIRCIDTPDQPGTWIVPEHERKHHAPH